MGSQNEYLEYVLNELLPVNKTRKTYQTVDIFIEESAFDARERVALLPGQSQANGF
jgi:hypothetical protein